MIADSAVEPSAVRLSHMLSTLKMVLEDLPSLACNQGAIESSTTKAKAERIATGVHASCQGFHLLAQEC